MSVKTQPNSFEFKTNDIYGKHPTSYSNWMLFDFAELFARLTNVSENITEFIRV